MLWQGAGQVGPVSVVQFLPWEPGCGGPAPSDSIQLILEKLVPYTKAISLVCT